MAKQILQLKFLEHYTTTFDDSSLQILRSEITNRMYLLMDSKFFVLEQSQNDDWNVRSYSNELYSDSEYKLRHTFNVDTGTDLLIVTFDRGIKMLKCDNENLTLHSTHEMSDGNNQNWNINETDIGFGRFYPDISRMGMIKRTRNTTASYEISNGFAIRLKPNDNSEILNLNCDIETKLMIVRLRKVLQQMAICQCVGELCVFRFDATYRMELIMRIPYRSWSREATNKDEKFFFANISGHPDWLDIIVFTSMGMFVLRFDESFKDFYKLFLYNPMFSGLKGWTAKHTESVKFEDINGDGIDDLLFTGPAGIGILSYDIYRNKWKSLINIEQLAVDERHTTILNVIPQTGDDDIPATIIFSHHSNAVHIAKLIETPAEMLKIPSIYKNCSHSTRECFESFIHIYPRTTQNQPRSTLYLQDQNIWFDQRETMNPRTGKPHFVLPLVGTSDEMVKFHLIYDANNNNAKTPIGRGWSIYQNFIALSYQDGNFPEDDIYIWIFDNMPQKLQILYEKSSDEEFHFELDTFGKEKISAEAKKVRVLHKVSSSTWEIDCGNSLKLLYGEHGEFGAVATDLGWANWRGRGFDKTNILERAHIWYLAATEFNGIRSYYKYEVNRKSSNSDSFNVEAFLIRIHDDFNEIQFSYERHPSSDEESENVDYYLANYTYRTKKVEQIVLFKRSLVGDTLLLTDIEQMTDSGHQSVTHYEYSEVVKGKYVMKKNIFPTGVEIAYNYILLGNPEPITKSSARRIPISDDYNISYGLGFILFSYLDKDTKIVILRMFNNDLTEEIYPSNKKSMDAWPQLHYSNAEAHEILIGIDFVVVIIYSDSQKQTCLFGRQSDDSWKVPAQCHAYSEQSTILKENNYILVSDPMSNIFLIEWRRDKNKWETQLNMNGFDSVRSISAYGNKFVIYDDKSITFGYKSKKYPQIWNVKNLVAFPGYLNSTKNVLRKFNLKMDFLESLWGFFRNNAIQFRHNLIVLSSLGIHNDEVFVTQIKTFVIGADYNVVSQDGIIVMQDRFSELFSVEEFNSHGDKFSLKYVYRDGKFNIELATFKSPTGRIGVGAEIYEKMNFPRAQRFLLDLKNYHVSLRGQVVVCRNIKYVFAGHTWRETTIENFHEVSTTSVSLGDRFVVNKTVQDATFKLYDASNHGMLFDFGTKVIKDIQINYPIYIASHNKESLNVMEFLEGYGTAFTNSTLPKSMQLSPFGNAMSLVTTEIDSNGTKNLFIWPMYNIRRYLPNFVVVSVRVVIGGRGGGGSKQRITGYVYNKTTAQLGNNGIHYGEMTVLPGNSRNQFGYYTIGEHFVEYFNGKSSLVKKVQIPNQSEERSSNVDDVEDNSKETTLYDRSGALAIARFPQILLSYQMAGYIGFENYEKDAPNWSYDLENIIRGNFSLTGQNYLRLQTKPMKGVFQPEFQDRPFLVSCWIRTSQSCDKLPNIQDIVPFLTLIVLTANGNHLMHFLAEVKLQIDNYWSYLEVGVDMELMHLISEEDQDLKLEIRIASTADSPTIDLDNIRFSSLRNIFDVNIYDTELAKCVAIIKSNGAIMRFIYDKYETKIAEINESNQIEEFITYTKCSHHSTNFRNPHSIIKLIPEKGYFQYFPFIIFRKRYLSTNFLYLETSDIDSDSYGFRCLYSLPNESDFIISNFVKLQRTIDDSQTTIALRNEKTKTKQKIPAEGELLLLKIHSRVIVWVDGSLCIDQHSDYGGAALKVIVAGQVQFREIMIFSRPQIRVSYKNALNEEIQEISLSSTDKAIVREQFYDELGRQRITTKSVEMVWEREQSVVSYVADLVTNDDPNETDAVWKTGRLKGVINNLVRHEFGYSEVVYDKDPLNTKIRMGIAGEKFSATGQFARHLNVTISNPFLTWRYPSGPFTYQNLTTPSGGEIIYVFNQTNNLPIAVYIHVKKGRDRFSTFEYNDLGQMIKCLPSLYYEKTAKFDGITLNLIEVSSENKDQKVEKEEVEKIATLIDYDGKGNPHRKTSPDAGPIENLYDDDNRLRFIIQYLPDMPDKIQFIVYFKYDEFGRLTSTGSLKAHQVPLSQLFRVNISEANGIEYQRFYHSDSEQDPLFRRNILRAITMHNERPFHEEYIFNTKGNVISKRIVIPNGSDRPEIIAIDKRFERELAKEIIYPASMFGESFRVAYEYDMLGRMVSVGVPGESDRFLAITYNADNQIASEVVTRRRKNKFTRRYRYNEPGFLIEIDDPFLREQISYTEKGYGSRWGYGDGTITRVKFFAKWHQLANSNGIGVHEDQLNFAPKCFQELKREGYLDGNNQQTRVLYPQLDVMLSLACTNQTIERKVKEILGKYGFPKEYGYRFDYTDHMELRKAKYFVGTTEPTSLQPSAFHREISGIDMAQSKSIWELLKSKGYIIEDENAYGLQGKTFLRSTLLEDLKSVNPEFTKYEPLLRKLLVMQYSKKSSNISFSNVFAQWFPNASADSVAIYQLLSRKNYFANPLRTEFVDSLKNFSSFLPSIVAVLHRYFAVGRTEFDMESSAIDSNGNILQISIGYMDYQLKYKENSNQISEVIDSNTEKSFKLNHDICGNVNQAFHKDLRIMEYHPVSNRLQKVLMVNEAIVVEFFYDIKGERTVKEVTNGLGRKLSKTKYFRDECGRVLVERRSTFVAPDQAPDILVTMYIYGPKSLVGFVRRDQFYSVITDHEGSVRLIVRDGEVVAAYDYTPYGDLMRVYGTNPDAHILYRYTGQEWDPDLSLYNYHARFYDPTIGRFYQADPMAQYLSPYKYAGNSPISMIDSNGEFGFMLVCAIIASALFGAYLGGVATNDNLNPYDWNWSSRDTQLAVFVGAANGALLPIGFSASVVALGGFSIATATLVTSIGLATTYINVVANNNELNPVNWDYVSLKTWNAALEGFSMGVNIIVGWHLAGKTFRALSTKGKLAFGAVSAFYSGLSFIRGGIETDWDLSKAEFWSNTIISGASTFDLSILGRKIIKFVSRHRGILLKNSIKAKNALRKLIEKVRQNNVPFHLTIQDFLQSNQFRLPRITEKGAKDSMTFGSFMLFSITAIYLMNGDIAQWDQMHMRTYHNFLNAHIISGQYLEAITTANSEMPTAQLTDAVLKNLRGAAYQITIIRRLGRFIRSSISGTRPFNNLQCAKVTNFKLFVQFADIALVFTRNHLTDPFIITKGKITIDDPTLVTNLIGNTPKILQNMIHDNFQQLDLVTNENTTHFDRTIVEKCKQEIERLLSFKNSSIIDRDSIDRIVGNLILENNQTRLQEQKCLAKEKELIALEEKLNFISIRSTLKVKLFIVRKYLKILIKDLKRQEREIIGKSRMALEKIIWNKLKTFYENSVEIFEIDNFVAQQTIELEKAIYLPNPNAFDFTQDINFVSSHKSTQLPLMTTFQKCFNCIKTAAKARINVRDIRWLAFLNANYIESSPQKNIERKRRFISANNEDNTNSSTTETEVNGSRKSFQNTPRSTKLNLSSDKNEKEKSIPNMTASPWSLIDFGDKLMAQVTNNETLLLTDVLLAKYKKCKLFRVSPNSNSNSVYTLQLALACELILLSERTIQAAANACGIPANYLDMSCEFKLQKQILEMLTDRKFDKIPDLIISFALSVLPEGNNLKFGKLSRRKIKRYQTFLRSFNFNSQIDKIIKKIVFS